MCDAIGSVGCAGEARFAGAPGGKSGHVCSGDSDVGSEFGGRCEGGGKRGGGTPGRGCGGKGGKDGGAGEGDGEPGGGGCGVEGGSGVQRILTSSSPSITRMTSSHTYVGLPWTPTSSGNDSPGNTAGLLSVPVMRVSTMTVFPTIPPKPCEGWYDAEHRTAAAPSVARVRCSIQKYRDGVLVVILMPNKLFPSRDPVSNGYKR
mmetsp:Transcript_14867/g.45428  ORF Transcript_14867/g.45428 Transcript_14867/m.45428 type:complete len:204 (-) Transcript_14867:897-1508(-)